MKKLLIFFCALFFLKMGYGQIADEYLKEESSDAIVISDSTHFIINSPDKSYTIRDYEYILKNRRSKSLKNIYIFYDQFLSVKDAEVHILSMDNEVIEKFKLKDFDDLGLGQNSVASDGRVKMLSPAFNKYPFKIKVHYEVEKQGSLHYPIWDPQPAEKLRLINASFSVTDNAGNSLRFRAVNVNEVDVHKKDGSTVYSWRLSDLSPYTYERFNRNSEDYEPIVYTAPNKFTVEGYSGSMSSWDEFGLWAAKLNEGKNNLQDELLTDLDDLVNQASSNLEKVAIVYDYLQTHTRYVSIQLGIGGWQPFSASYVYKNKYGDCKALSNFTKTLLDRYDIKSYYTLIKAGANASEVNSEFPNAHFNHAIVTVPIKQDTIFLECTSQTNPFGYLGKFTSDRNAVMITENGGKLIRTKKYTPEENLQSTTIEMNMNKDGLSHVDIKRVFTGIEIDNQRFSRLYQKPESERSKWIKDNYRWSNNAKIISLELSELKEGVVPTAGFEISLENYKAGKKMGKRYFLKPGQFITSYLSKMSGEKREKPIRVRYGYTQVDTISYELPNYMATEMGIETVSISTEFGKYSLETNRIKDKLIYVRKMVLFDGNYEPAKYEAFKGFINEVVKNDRRQIVLLNKT